MPEKGRYPSLGGNQCLPFPFKQLLPGIVTYDRFLHVSGPEAALYLSDFMRTFFWGVHL